MTASQLLTRSTPPAADLAAIEATKARIAEIIEIQRRTEKDPWLVNFSRRSYRHEEVDRISNEFAQNPSFELAEELNRAIVRGEEAERTGATIGTLAHGAIGTQNAKLAPVVEAIVDRALTLLDSQAAEARKHAAEAAKSPLATGREVAEVESRIADLRGQLENHRGQAAADPLGWLSAQAIGIGVPEVAPAPEVAPTPPAKPAFRGRVPLKPEPEPAPVADVIDQLDDGDDPDADPLELLGGD